MKRPPPCRTHGEPKVRLKTAHVPNAAQLDTPTQDLKLVRDAHDGSHTLVHLDLLGYSHFFPEPEIATDLGWELLQSGNLFYVATEEESKFVKDVTRCARVIDKTTRETWLRDITGALFRLKPFMQRYGARSFPLLIPEFSALGEIRGAEFENTQYGCRFWVDIAHIYRMLGLTFQSGSASDWIDKRLNTWGHIAKSMRLPPNSLRWFAWAGKGG